MSTRTFVRFTVVMSQAGGVTTPNVARPGEADALIEVDPLGRVVVPGTSLAGSLRAEWTRTLGAPAAEQAFGRVGDDRATASRWWVYDAIGPRVKDAGRFIRQRTAIDTHRGAALPHALWITEMLPAGTTFKATLMVEDATEEDLNALDDVLATWRPRLGAATSTGHGCCDISSVRWGTLNLADQKDLLRWSTVAGPALAEEVAVEPRRAPAVEPALLRTRWRVAGPVLVAQRVVENNRQVAQPLEEGGVPVIPGTSIKGAVRARMGYILRSVGVSACVVGASYHGRHQPTCGHCLLCVLFGSGGGDNEDRNWVGRRGRLIAHTATIRFSGRIPLRRNRTRVAIDRFTGGVAQRSSRDTKVREPGSRDGKLFSINAVEQGELDIVWDATELSSAEERDAIALLRLVYQDLHDGLFGVGHGVHSGYGDIRADLTGQTGDSLPVELERFLPLAQARERLHGLANRSAKEATDA